MDNELHEASERTYRAIGRFIFEFSQAEYAIRYHLALALGLKDEYFDAVIGSYDAAMLCTVASNVFEKSLSEYNFKKINVTINKFRGLNDNRVRVVHGLWVPFIDGGTVHHTPRSLKSKTSANQAASLEKLADEAAHLRAEIERGFFELEKTDTFEKLTPEAREEIRRKFPFQPDEKSEAEPDEWI